MTEEEARAAVRNIVGSHGYARLEKLTTLVVAENQRQNLMARSTIDTMWNRHVLDSVQLLRWDEGRTGAWIDIGTGGGFPGLAVGAVADREMVLVEPRHLRAAFLRDAADSLGLTQTTVIQAKIASVPSIGEVISARAVAAVPALIAAARHCMTATTRWMFLKGQVTADDVTAFATQTGMVFHVEQSLSDPASVVLIADPA